MCCELRYDAHCCSRTTPVTHAFNFQAALGRHGDPPGFAYGDRCVFVSNDWHAALVPSYLAAKYRRHGVYQARPLFDTTSCVVPTGSAQTYVVSVRAMASAETAVRLPVHKLYGCEVVHRCRF